MKQLLTFLLILTITNMVAQPGPGDVFREYVWLPEMVGEQGKFLRVGGRLDYKSNTDHYPPDKRKDGYIPLEQNIDLKDAIKAELVIEKLGSHDDTKNLRVSINQHPFIVFPVAKGIPEPESAYMHHHYPIVKIPLEQLKEGMDNSFRFDVDSTQRWNWPQNIIYGVILRVYYPPESAFFKTEISGVKEDGILQSEQKLGLADANKSIRRVEYIGYYDDINWEGDGVYEQWHYHYFRGQVIHNIGTANIYPYTVAWNTSWIPDQDNIKVAARIVSNNGLIYFTKAVEGLSFDRNFSVELCKPYNQPKNWVTRQDEFTASFDLKSKMDEVEEARAYWVSWSPCYANGVFINDQKIFDRSTLCYEYMAHEVEVDPACLKQGANIIRTCKEPLHDGQMVHGMEVQWPGIMIKVKNQHKPAFKATVEDYEGRAHYVIETSKVSYYYDIKGGGFSRIIDEAGNDWVSFKMEPWGEYPAAAASAFRGLPNMVFQEEDDGAGHPGHNKCTSWIEDKKVVTESLSGKWKWSWEFFDDHAMLTVLKADPDRAYWFLYEGTPGGTYDPVNTYFGTSNAGPAPLNYDYYRGNIYRDNYRWMYVGHKDVSNTFYMVHCTEDDLPDMTSMLGNTKKGIDSPDGMTVFAFGRGEGVDRFLKGRNKFIIGMFPNKANDGQGYRELSEFIGQKLVEQQQ